MPVLSALEHLDLRQHWPAAVVLVLIVAVVWYSPRPDNGAPPRVPYTWPWVGSALDMSRDMDGFVEDARQKYGGVFTVYAIGQKTVYVTSPKLISTVYKQSKIFVMSPLQFTWMSNIFGMSAKALEGSVVGEHMFPVMQRLLSPAHVTSLTVPFAQHSAMLIRRLAESLRITSSASLYTQLQPIIYTLVFDAASMAMFGPTFQSSHIQKDFQVFDESVPLLAMGCPSFLLSRVRRARQRLFRYFESYISTPHEPSELVHEIESLAMDNGWGKGDISAYFLGILWPLQANSPYAVYWLLVLLLQEPEGLAPLGREIDEAHLKWTLHNPGKDFHENILPFLAEHPLPLLASSIQEMLRLCTCSFSMRSVQARTTQLGTYELHRGDNVICYTRTAHMDDAEFPDAHKFISSRFLRDDSHRPGTGTHLPFGGGISQCEGRYLALGQIRVFVVLLLTTLSIEVAEGETPAKVGYREGHRGFGLIRPEGDVDVVLGVRDMGGES